MLRTVFKYTIPVLLIWVVFYTQKYYFSIYIHSASDFEYSLTSKNFIFHSDGAEDIVEGFSKVSNALVENIQEYIPNSSVNAPMNVYVLRNESEMHRFLSQHMGGRINSKFGGYLSKENVLVTHVQAGLGTLAHILAYPVIENSFQNGPYWVKSGFPTLFEKIYGFPNDNEYEVSYGYHNPWRLIELGDVLSLSLPAIISAEKKSDVSQSAKRMAIMFIYQKGMLKKYLDLVLFREKGPYGTYIENVFKKEMSLLVDDWKEYLHEVEQHRDELMTIPNSRTFASKNSFLSEIQPFMNM